MLWIAKADMEVTCSSRCKQSHGSRFPCKVKHFNWSLIMFPQTLDAVMAINMYRSLWKIDNHGNKSFCHVECKQNALWCLFESNARKQCTRKQASTCVLIFIANIISKLSELYQLKSYPRHIQSVADRTIVSFLWWFISPGLLWLSTVYKMKDVWIIEPENVSGQGSPQPIII